MTTKPVVEENSESILMDDIFRLCDAGGSVIQVRTREAVRTATVLRKALLTNDKAYQHYEWDVVNGFRTFTTENYTNDSLEGDGAQFMDALMKPLSDLRSATSQVNTLREKIHCFVFVDTHPYINGNPFATTLLQQYAAILPSSNVCMIFVTPDVSFSELPMGTVLVTDMPTPKLSELKSSLNKLVQATEQDDWDRKPEVYEEDVERIAHLGLGMTRYEFETHVALAIVQASIDGEECLTADILMEGVSKGKTEVVKQSDILELFHPEDMSNVGGMQRLKDWVTARADNFSDSAKDFGIEPPKGIALVGVPGGGKSLVAKAVAGSFKVPLIRLDFGRVFSKYIGDSESRMRQALNMVSQMGRLVLFADEIDKGLGGIGSGGDSGTSSRVLGAFLTWMQENKSDVFVVMTANRIEGLPPEIFRKGRLDQVFSVGLPNNDERLEVLAVHLRKRGRDIKAFSKSELTTFVEQSRDYLPAEIEASVKDALVIAYNDTKAEDLEMGHIITALKEMVPMSVSHEAQINAIKEWAAKNATPVSYEEKTVANQLVNSAERRTTTRPRPSRTTTH